MKRGFVRRAIVWTAIGTAALAAATYALWPRPTIVDTARVTRGQLRITIDEDGEIRAHDRYVVTAPITGRLMRMTLREGDRVRSGQVIAVLVPVPMPPGEKSAQLARVEAAQALYREAQSRTAHARADLAQAQRELTRGEVLLEGGAMPKQLVEQLRTAVTSATSDLSAARARETSADADVRAARANLRALEVGQPIEVRAPVDAELLRIDEASERVVSAGTPLMLLADPSRYEVRLDVLSTDAVKVSPGMRVSVEDWGGEAPIEARVRIVEPGAFTKVSALGVEEQRVYVIADLASPPGRLNDGYRVEGRIVIWERPDVLRVPIGALYRCGQAWCVFSVEHGRALQRVVDIGQRNEEEAQVLDGLRDRETVVVYPPSTLVAGARVRAR